MGFFTSVSSIRVKKTRTSKEILSVFKKYSYKKEKSKCIYEKLIAFALLFSD